LRRNWRITNELDRDRFAPTQRMDDNLAALRIVQSPYVPADMTTEAQAAALARFVGWGGLSRYFEADKLTSAPDRERAASLRALLSDEVDYHAAADSTLNAHYTSKEVVLALWSAASALGYAGGKILEPGAGVGNFLGLIPERLADKATFFAVEKEPMTAEILRRLYPQAEVHNTPFEDFPRQGGPFDLVIGNVPFAEVQPYDPAYRREPRYTLHDYFFRKGIDLLKPGGVMVALTSTGTLDKKDPTARRELLRHAELLNVARLPSEAMRAVANTDVVVDALVFAKRPEPLTDEGLEQAVEQSEWIEVRDHVIEAPSGQSLTDQVNRWFDRHPASLLGGSFEQANMQAGRLVLGVRAAADWQDRFEVWANDLAIHAPRLTAMKAEADASERRNEALHRPFDTHDVDGRLDNRGGVWTVVERKYGSLTRSLVQLSDSEVAALTPALKLRDTLFKLVDLELTDATDEEVARLRQEMNAFYDEHYSERGLNSRRWPGVFQEDPWFGRFMALEKVEDNGKTVEKADIFTRRTSIRAPSYPDRVDTPEEALFVSFAETGRIDMDRIASLCDLEAERATSMLLATGTLFQTPDGGLEIGARYLSGNVRLKHREASIAVQNGNEALAVNVERLAEIIPETIPADDIGVQLGAVWITPSEIEDFASETLGYGRYSRIEVTYSAKMGDWSVRYPSQLPIRDVEKYGKYSTDRITAIDVLEHALAGRSPKIMDDIGEGKRIVNIEQTLLAHERVTALQDQFRQWVFYEDEERRDLMVRRYNDRFNSYVPPKYDGSFLQFPGMNTDIALRKPQRDAVARALFERRVVLAHKVGVGKTFTQIAIAYEWKRLRFFNKPMIIVKNNMLDQFANEAQALYPGARILVIRKEDLSKANRAKFVGRIANNDWDFVIATHSVFGRIGMSRATQVEFMDKELDLWREATEDLVYGEKNSGKMRGRSAAKRIAKMVATKEAKLKELRQQIDDNQDEGVTFEMLGVDAIIVDESHKFKNGGVQIPGRDLALTESQRSIDLQMKLDWLESKHRERVGFTLASGTPISNHVLELYVLNRYTVPDVLREAGMETPTAWVSNFVGSKSQWEPSTTGDGFVLKERPFYMNARELLRITRHVVDTATADDANLKLPEAKSETVTCLMSSDQETVMIDIMERAKAVKARKVEPKEDNMLKIVGDGRKVSLDPRMLDLALRDNLGIAEPEDWEDSKGNNITQKVKKHYEESHDILGTQLIFLDIGVNERHGFSLYDDLKAKLVAAGIPKAEIAYIHDADTDEEKEALSEKVRSGSIRVLLGSTEKMGEGTNFQDRLVAIHHGDAPWRPSDIEQRNGRGVRQGNISSWVWIYYYVAKGNEDSLVKGSLDAFMYAVLDTKWRAFSKFVFGDIEECDRIISMDADSGISYGEIVAAASGDERIKRKFTLEAEVMKLRRLETADRSEKYSVKQKISYTNASIKEHCEDIAVVKELLKEAEPVRANAPDVLSKPEKTGAYNWLVLGHKNKEGGPLVLGREEAVRACRVALFNETAKSDGEGDGHKPTALIPHSGFVNLLYRGLRVSARLDRDSHGGKVDQMVWRLQDKSGKTLSRSIYNTDIQKYADSILSGEWQKEMDSKIVDLEEKVVGYVKTLETAFPRAQELADLQAELEVLTKEIEATELGPVKSETVAAPIDGEPDVVSDAEIEMEFSGLGMT
jgi:N12 class adenine-specific DNA methylase